jgi:luciferase-type oxidoreductase
MNPALSKIAKKGKLSIGILLPIESYQGAVPTLENHVQLAQRAEELGFKSLWFRDVPFLDPNFGDVGQILDPLVYMGYLAAKTKKIVFATGSIILTLRHPINIAKGVAILSVYLQ